MKRESGANPEQTRYCKLTKMLEQTSKPLSVRLRWEGSSRKSKSGDLPKQTLLPLSRDEAPEIGIVSQTVFMQKHSSANLLFNIQSI